MKHYRYQNDDVYWRMGIFYGFSVQAVHRPRDSKPSGIFYDLNTDQFLQIEQVLTPKEQLRFLMPQTKFGWHHQKSMYFELKDHLKKKSLVIIPSWKVPLYKVQFLDDGNRDLVTACRLTRIVRRLELEKAPKNFLVKYHLLKRSSGYLFNPFTDELEFEDRKMIFEKNLDKAQRRLKEFTNVNKNQ